MITSAKAHPVSTIISIDEKAKYFIPKYQREYVWGKDKWEYFFNDLVENDEGYFLGSIICINKGTDALITSPLEVVDGQQRLTSISLLYCAIYKKLLAIDRNDDDFRTDLTNLKNRLILKSEKDNPRLELSDQNNNHQDYLSILGELGILNAIEKQPHLGNRRIYKTYSYFLSQIESFDCDKLLKMLTKVNSATLVKIEVVSHADAFTLFESLNTRGEPLSAIDLVKNNLLSELDKKKILLIDKAFEEWKKIINNLGEDPTDQERFLRQFYNAFRYKPEIKLNIKGGNKATRSNLITIYDKLIERNPKFILDELNKKAVIYNKFIETSKEPNFSKELTDLSRIGATPAYTFLLYLFSEFHHDTNLIGEITKFLIKYFVRRNLTDFPATRNLDSIFMGLIDECEAKKNNLSKDIVIEYLTGPDRFQTFSIFETMLHGDIYENNPDVTRFLLCSLEEGHFTKEHHPDLWERDEKNKLIWTIEHVFPEGERIPKEWIQMMADGDKEKAEMIQEKLVHKIGNLTLTGYNSQLSNWSFEKKRDRKDKKGEYIGYKNKLFLNKELAELNSWKSEDIKKRSNMLVKAILNKFKLESE